MLKFHRRAAVRLAVLTSAILGCVSASGVARASVTQSVNAFDTTDASTVLPWTAGGSLTYGSWQVSGNVWHYQFDSNSAATVTLARKTSYNGEDVYFRALVYYGENTVVWQSCTPGNMDRKVLHGDSGDNSDWTPPDPVGLGYQHGEWEGSEQGYTSYKVQSGADGDLGARSFVLQNGV